jgi:hypothetical protein
VRATGGESGIGSASGGGGFSPRSAEREFLFRESLRPSREEESPSDGPLGLFDRGGVESLATGFSLSFGSIETCWIYWMRVLRSADGGTTGSTVEGAKGALFAAEAAPGTEPEPGGPREGNFDDEFLFVESK